MKSRWIFGGALLLVFSFAASVWSYRTSLNRAEPMIAVAQPASVTTAPFNLTGFTKETKLKIYSVDPAWPLKFVLVYNSASYEYSLPSGGSVETAFSVKPGDTVNVSVYHIPSGILLYGWAIPTDPSTRYCKGKTDPIVAAATTAGEGVVSVQCWNDDSSGDDPWDDFELVFTQPGAAVSPSPSPSPSPLASASPAASASPQPSPSPSPSASASPSPSASPAPTQPDTGTPTFLTAILAVSIMVITIIKIITVI